MLRIESSLKSLLTRVRLSAWKCTVVVLASGLLSAFTHADVSESIEKQIKQQASHNGAAALLMQQLTPLEAIAGSFEQKQTGAEGDLLSESNGTFKMQRPGMLRWKTLEPFPQLLVTDGSDIWMYDPDLEQVTVSKVTSQLASTPAVIFSGDLEQLERQYYVTSSELNLYRLKPRSSNNSLEQLDLRFDGGLLSQMTILDSFGQTTEFLLQQVAPVEPMSTAEFQFTAPEGTDVFFNE